MSRNNIKTLLDANHDGVFDTRYAGPDYATIFRPYRFWANDNNDYGDTEGDDMPGTVPVM